ncbi:MAG: GH92 family glycosyl hydrolase, partial [Planctomycetota bacterium]
MFRIPVPLFFIVLILMLTVTCEVLAVEQKQPVDWVDPMLGTVSSRWMLYPGPSMPFGMVKLSPDNTEKSGLDAGYEYMIESIAGFGCVHSWGMGSFLTMPTTGRLKVVPGSENEPGKGYRSRFSHDKEIASPGY